jgi:hypothetical protein
MAAFAFAQDLQDFADNADRNLSRRICADVQTDWRVNADGGTERPFVLVAHARIRERDRFGHPVSVGIHGREC